MSDENSPDDAAGDDTKASKKSRSLSQKKNSHKDTRREGRRIVHKKCEVTLDFDNGEETVAGYAIDISSLGIGLIAEKFVNSGKPITISIFTSEFTFELKGYIVWCRELPSTNKVIKTRPGLSWRVGIEFTPQSDPERQTALGLAKSL